METKIVFMGSPQFAVPVLEELNTSFNVIGVVTQPDRPAGRGRKITASPIKRLAQSYKIPVIQPQSLKYQEAMDQLSAWAPDLIVVAAFGQILRKPVLQLPKFGCINVHASLLPRWRGAAPVHAAMLAGDKRTGITIMQMDEGLDTGAIIEQRDVPIRPNTTGGELTDQLSFLGARTLVEILPSFLNGSKKAIPQDETKATFAPKLQKEDGLILLQNPAQQLARQVLAFNPWPGAFYLLDGKILKIHLAHAHDTYECEMGGHYIVNDFPALGTAEGLLVLDQVQPEGKRIMDGVAFLNGLKDWL